MATKTLILVRHGQYTKAEGQKLEKLTALGRKQAGYAGKRLKENKKINRIVHSTMPRAIETANIIKKVLGYKQTLQSSDSLRECVPGFPKRLRKKYGYTDEAKLNKDQAQADLAFQKYFKASKKNSVEVLVCHGNIIRYLVGRILNLPSESWLSMDIQQCGISIITLKTSGSHKQQLISHNDVGHIPKAERTFI